MDNVLKFAGYRLPFYILPFFIISLFLFLVYYLKKETARGRERMKV